MPDITFSSFAGGEIGPAYYARTDQEGYFVSAKALRNYIATQTGPAVGRGGTVYTAKTKSGGKVLLVPFQFNEQQAYVVEFGDHYCRFYKEHGQISESALTITGATQANPIVLTVNNALNKGRTVSISGVVGMTQLNGNTYLTNHVLGSGKNITDLDRSSPVRISIASSHGFVGGERVFIESAGGMTQVNDRTFELVSIELATLAITGITQANPAVVTVSGSHGLTDGDTVLIEDAGGMTQVNNRRFVISPKYSATKSISAITQANPAVVTTSTNHGFDSGDTVLIESVSGMTQVNDREFTIGRSLQASKTVDYITLSGTAPVRVVTAAAHSMATGDFAFLSGFGEAVELNAQWTVTVINSTTFDLDGSNSASITRPASFVSTLYFDAGTPISQEIDKNKFTLVGEDSTSHTAYTSGGTAKENLQNQFELDGENSTSHTAYTSGGSATEIEVNDFYLKGENGLRHTAWTSGGTVKQVSNTSMKLQTLAGVDVNSTAYTAYSSGGSMTAIHEIVSPYDADDLFDSDGIPLLQWAQSNDFLFLAHPDYPPHQLTRMGHADWAISEFINEEGPFLDENLDDLNIYVQSGGTLGPGGVVTLVADAPIWEADHVGAMWQLRLRDGATSPVWVTNTAFTVGQEVLSGDLFYRCTDAGTSGTEAPTHDIGEAYDGASTSSSCKWKYIHNGRGIVIITGFTNAQQVTATVITELPAGLVGISNATGRWNEGAWSYVQGFPRAVALHESRLVWGGTEQDPLSLDFSNTESLFYYNPVELDGTVVRSSAFRRSLDSNNPIRWMKSTEKGLIIGTLAGEWVVATEGITQGFGPDTANARQFSENGAAAIMAIRNGDSILYPQRGRQSIRDITFSIDQQKLVTTDRNIRADHILLEGVTATAYAEAPHRVMWCLLGDGSLAGLTYNREAGAQVSAWHRHTIGGAFSTGDAVVESIAVIPSPDEVNDDLWLSIKRTINSETVRYVEWMKRPLEAEADIEDGIFMDSAISYSGSPATNVTGLGHLEGQTVAVLADGVYTTNTVTNGTLATPLATAASTIHVGLYKLRYIETVNIESGPGDKVNTKALMKRVYGVQIEVVESAKGWAGTAADTLTETNMDQLVFDEFYDEDGAPRRISGFVEETINDGFEKRKSVRIEQREPYPSVIASITARFEVGAQ